MATATAASEHAFPADVTPIWKLGLRDVTLALAGLSLFAAADTWHATTGLALAGAVSVLDGILAGVGIGILAHEWGHFAGARLGGGIAPTKEFSSLFPIFVLDMERSDPTAFRAMGVGGNLAHWGLVIAIALLLPMDAPGRVALLAGAFGFAVSASVTEFPVIARAYSGATPTQSFKGLTREKLRRDRWIGFAAGIGLLVLM
jgi:hypothetical protein